MNSNKYFRLLLSVTVLMVIGLVIISSKDDVLDLGMTVKPQGVEVSQGKDINHRFPLHSSLTKSKRFSPIPLQTFDDPIKLIDSLIDEGNSGTSDVKLNEQEEERICNDLTINHEIEVSANKLLPAELEIVLEQLKLDEHASNLIKGAEDKFKLKLPVEAQWFRFSGSSVWLEDLKVHYLVSRLIFSPSGIPNKGFASFVYVQVFNQKWEEITTELEIPYEKRPEGEGKEGEDKEDKAKGDKTKEYKAKEDKAKQDKAKQDKAKEDKAKEDKSKEDKAKEDKSKEDKAKEDKAKEDKAKEDKAKEDKAKEDKVKEVKAKEDKAKENKSKENKAKDEKTKEDKTKDDKATDDKADDKTKDNANEKDTSSITSRSFEADDSTSQTAFRRMKFPALVPIHFDYAFTYIFNNLYWGPEDPRIVKRLNPRLGFEEPIIVFNMKSMDLEKRVMHIYLPFSQEMKVLKKRNQPYANIEKNWTPFISSKQQNDTLNFVYSFSPLEVVNCEIDTGMCDFVQKASKSNINQFGLLRGATQLERLPIENLPPVIKNQFMVANRDIYVGWGKIHLNKCGCGESMYRPTLVVLAEDYDEALKEFFYRITAISEFIDFNADIPPWFTPKLDDKGNLIVDDQETTTNKCEKSARNVLVPNSIAYWNIKDIVINDQTYGVTEFNEELSKLSLASTTSSSPILSTLKLENIQFNDYMGVTLSAADNDVSISHIKGFMNYLLKIDSLFDQETVVTSKDMLERKGININQKCSERAAKRYCVEYGKANGA